MVSTPTQNLCAQGRHFSGSADSSTGTPFSISASADYFFIGALDAYGEADDTHIKSQASIVDDFAYSYNTTTSTYSYHYQAGSLLHFFADVSLEGTPITGALSTGVFGSYTANNQSSASLNVSSTDGTLKSFASLAKLGYVYSETSTLDVYIYSPFDKDITFTVKADTYSELLSVSSVPEPETYGMMLVGLGLMGLVAKRKKAS